MEFDIMKEMFLRMMQGSVLLPTPVVLVVWGRVHAQKIPARLPSGLLLLAVGLYDGLVVEVVQRCGICVPVGKA
jgi:hypothetical protein